LAWKPCRPIRRGRGTARETRTFHRRVTVHKRGIHNAGPGGPGTNSCLFLGRSGPSGPGIFAITNAQPVCKAKLSSRLTIFLFSAFVGRPDGRRVNSSDRQRIAPLDSSVAPSCAHNAKCADGRYISTYNCRRLFIFEWIRRRSNCFALMTLYIHRDRPEKRVGRMALLWLDVAGAAVATETGEGACRVMRAGRGGGRDSRARKGRIFEFKFASLKASSRDRVLILNLLHEP
jgi:hypothetical protein